MHPDQASPGRAKTAFGFLSDLGFRLQERSVSGGNTSRDGWQLVYSNNAVIVTVQYLDMQLEVFFIRAGLKADYLFLDRELFARRSGLHGSMFPPEKVGPVVDRVATNIQEQFQSILGTMLNGLASSGSSKPRRPRRGGPRAAA